jgi:hypothetical protein
MVVREPMQQKEAGFEKIIDECMHRGVAGYTYVHT